MSFPTSFFVHKTPKIDKQSSPATFVEEAVQDIFHPITLASSLGFIARSLKTWNSDEYARATKYCNVCADTKTFEV